MFDKSNFESTTVDGVVTLKYNDEKVFTKGDDTVTSDELKRVADYTSKYIKDATEVASSEAKAVLEKDSKVDKVIVEYPYSTSKRGNLNIAVNRSKTFTNPINKEEVIKSTIKVAVTDPISKMSKSKIKEMEADLTKTLLS